jgi:hypothetical protein
MTLGELLDFFQRFGAVDFFYEGIYSSKSSISTYQTSQYRNLAGPYLNIKYCENLKFCTVSSTCIPLHKIHYKCLAFALKTCSTWLKTC